MSEMAIINPATIFLPMLAVVALTFIGFVLMAAARGAAMKAGQDPNFYRAHQGAGEPEATVVRVRHYHNLLELPPLFYAACLVAFALGTVGRWTLVFAWGYVVARIVQSAVHLSYNAPAHRGVAFMIGVLFLFALWLNVAIEVFAHL